MKINTLGPCGTDSYAAGLEIASYPYDEIILHDSYDEIIAKMATLTDQHIIMPVAFVSNSKNYDGKILISSFGINLKLLKFFQKKLIQWFYWKTHPLKSMEQ